MHTFPDETLKRTV